MIGSYNPWFIEELNRRVEEVRRQRSDDLATGNCGDIGEYRNECGKIEGLRLALDIANEIKQEIDRQ